MRILLISSYFYPDKTGVPKYSWEMAQWLAARGHEIHVLTGIPHYPEFRRPSGYPPWRFSSEIVQGVAIHRVPHYIPDSNPGALKRMLIDLTFLLSGIIGLVSMRRSRKGAFDCSIAVCPSLFDCILAFLFGRATATRWVFYIQDFQIDAASQMQFLSRSPLIRLLYRLEAFLLRKADLVISITAAMCRLADSKAGRHDRSVLIPNWCDISALRPGSPHNEFRAELGLSADDIVVMYAGAMGPKQDLDLIIGAAEALRDSAQIKFVLGGGGPEWMRLQAHCRTRGLANVRFVPLQPDDRLNLMLNAADIHLIVQIPQITDIVMPSKLANIFAVGRCVIATAAPSTALSYVILSSGGGLVVQPGNVAELQAAVVALATDAPRRARMGTAGRHYAEQHLDKGAALSSLEDQLETICRKAPAA